MKKFMFLSRLQRSRTSPAWSFCMAAVVILSFAALGIAGPVLAQATSTATPSATPTPSRTPTTGPAATASETPNLALTADFSAMMTRTADAAAQLGTPAPGATATSGAPGLATPGTPGVMPTYDPAHATATFAPIPTAIPTDATATATYLPLPTITVEYAPTRTPLPVRAATHDPDSPAREKERPLVSLDPSRLRPLMLLAVIWLGLGALFVYSQRRGDE